MRGVGFELELSQRDLAARHRLHSQFWMLTKNGLRAFIARAQPAWSQDSHGLRRYLSTNGIAGYPETYTSRRLFLTAIRELPAIEYPQQEPDLERACHAYVGLHGDAGLLDLRTVWHRVNLDLRSVLAKPEMPWLYYYAVARAPIDKLSMKGKSLQLQRSHRELTERFGRLVYADERNYYNHSPVQALEKWYMQSYGAK